jgi:hypothetical protein
MNKSLLSLLGCSGSIAAILANATVASPDAAKTIPYPQVMNLTQVPRFNYRGMIPQVKVARGKSTQYVSNKSNQKSVSSPPVKAVNLKYRNSNAVALEGIGCDCPSCRYPTQGMMMRLGT